MTLGRLTADLRKRGPWLSRTEKFASCGDR